MPSATFTSADRIRELSVINTDVSAMLAAAGQAINSLTNRPLPSNQDGDGHNHKQAFTENTTAYYTHLQAIVARLRRQVYALEEAGIIEAEARNHNAIAAKSVTLPGTGGQAGRTGPEPEKITNGGLGNLDVGWMNSRGNNVGAQKEAELIEEAKQMLEERLGLE
ncbi:hypothetical protein LTR66_003107 [Elasticomyces elasticus]|nr:hypothetical protein LTR50_005961 [Elasticomyces elasticus]KAK4997475.1 hypothetical protein LTR66_003107 [Elasticomyces elasticus]